jgi:hypothetical protein
VRQRPEQSVLEQEYVMRVPRPYTKLWVRANTLRQARYLEIIRKNDGVLGDKYFEDVDKRRSSAAGLRLIACAVQIPIFAFFVLSLIPIDANSSVLGVSPTSSKHLREILLVVSAVLALGTSFIGYHHDVLTEILAAHVEGRSKGDKDVQEMLKISYGIALFPLPPRTQGYLQLGRGFHLFVNIFAVLTAMTSFSPWRIIHPLQGVRGYLFRAKLFNDRVSLGDRVCRDVRRRRIAHLRLNHRPDHRQKFRGWTNERNGPSISKCGGDISESHDGYGQSQDQSFLGSGIRLTSLVARGCHPCLRYDLLPMSPGWTDGSWRRERNWDRTFSA